MTSDGAQHSANRARLKKNDERLNQVEQDVSEIKDMLKQLIER
jgi:Asp-tRNA(Asn)/Glu-tRNA(Gln) amidotransferase C subunit